MLRLDCVDDAMKAQKMYSDFFDTTEAEQEMERSTSTKRVKKTKKPQDQKHQLKSRKAVSDSEDEASGLFLFSF